MIDRWQGQVDPGCQPGQPDSLSCVSYVVSRLDPVEIIDTGADLNAYAKVDGQSGCCSPTMESGLPVVSCCTPSLHGQLADLLRKHSINNYAASVRVYAVKP